MFLFKAFRFGKRFHQLITKLIYNWIFINIYANSTKCLRTSMKDSVGFSNYLEAWNEFTDKQVASEI